MQNKVNAGTTGIGKLLVSLRVREPYCGNLKKLCKIGLTQVPREEERSWCLRVRGPYCGKFEKVV